MEFIRNFYNLQPRHYGCVLAIGNFDGFHRGHQAIISKLQVEGRQRRLPVIVMIFEPQPLEYFTHYTAPARLTQLRDKVKYLSSIGVDAIICVSFNQKFASLSARSFILDLLVQKLGVKLICVGNDFRFGTKREGDFTLLQQIGKKTGFEVISTITYTEDGKRISSTAIREALIKDRLKDAEILLGHKYEFSGRIVHGNAIGRTINFPTANISLKRQQTPINGVYIVVVDGLTKKSLKGVANIGTRPSVLGLHQRLEIHLLDINMNLYGRYVKVIIHAKIRNEQYFASITDLKRQIENDIVNTRNYFKMTTL